MTKLKRHYLDFNRRFFSNSLSTDLPVHWSHSLPSEIYGTFDEPTWGDGILINAYLKSHHTIAMLTLLHEMAHVVTDTEKAAHGPRWQREMRRLARIGAFDKLW